MMARLVVLAAAAALSACATSAPPPAAVVTYLRSDCPAAPDLAAATSLTPERERTTFAVTSTVETGAPCLTQDGVSSPYALFALPSETADKTIEAGGVLEAARIFAPWVSVLDASGAVTRTFEPGQYQYRGDVFSVVFRPRPEERFVLVTANEALVGQRYDALNLGTATSGTVAGGVYVSWTTGTEARVGRTFSYEGAVQVTVHDRERQDD